MIKKGQIVKTRNFATRITIIYILLGGIWILFSDNLMFILFSENHTLNLVSTYKGWFYVLFTGILLFLLVKGEMRKRNAIEDQLNTAKVKAEESEKLKTAFLNNISHEIRTPMNAIIGFSDLLVDPEIPMEQKKGFSSYIKKGVVNLLATIEDIIIVSHIQVGQLKLQKTQVDVILLLNELRNYYLAQIESIKKEKNLELTVQTNFKADDSMIIADFRNLRQVLNRLLSNSLKFTEVGKIELICEKTANDVCLFTVRDTGCGIAAEKRDIIFNAFRQADEATPGYKTAGTGLGLSIAKGLVELMNGKIWFESEAGKGSTFYFTIPYVKG